MSQRDNLGLAVTGATPAALEHYELALHQLQCFIGDPVASIDQALVLAPDFVMAHVFKGFLFGLVTDRDATAIAASCFAAAQGLGGTARERQHVRALGELSRGGWLQAGWFQAGADGGSGSCRRMGSPTTGSARVTASSCSAGSASENQSSDSSLRRRPRVAGGGETGSAGGGANCCSGTSGACSGLMRPSRSGRRPLPSWLSSQSASWKSPES